MTSERPPDGQRTKLFYMLRAPCEHENADHLFEGDKFEPWSRDVDITAKCEQFRCLDCEAWLSLGVANDAPEAVQIELRAVRLAADPLGVGCVATASEWIGWMSDHLGTRLVDHGSEFLSGYLAHCIATHEEP